MSYATLFDRDSYLVGESGTPPLEPANPNFEVVDTPPPLATTRESSLAPSLSGDEGRVIGAKGRRGKTKPSQSDALVLSQLDPNRPDIAKHALKHALDSESEAEEEDSTLRPNGNQMTATTITLQRNVPYAQNAVTNGHAHGLDDDDGEEDFVMVGASTEDVGLDRFTAARLPRHNVNGLQDDPSANGTTLSPSADIKAQKDYDTRPPPLQPTSPYRKSANESLSPGLAKNMIYPSEAGPENTLTPIQRSPPRSHCNGSPEHKLPPISTVSLGIDSAASPFSARSPGMVRASSASHFGPISTSHPYFSPHSAMSPPTTTNPAAWRSNTSGSASTVSDYGVTSASTMTSTPSSTFGRTPSHFPTPTTSASDQTHSDLYDEDAPTPEHPDQDSNEANGTGIYASGSFTCTVKDCTAAAFQTQYLLNSHMNVHSDTRPHFCPVSDCPRGPGGQGFKRKNEMIRHGLVHTSPGYMCPFCPDQQHKYPRPDNLQRHVRVHHVDKDRDDPQLRGVLAQRPEGGSRGRRRRLGS